VGDLHTMNEFIGLAIFGFFASFLPCLALGPPATAGPAPGVFRDNGGDADAARDVARALTGRLAFGTGALLSRRIAINSSSSSAVWCAIALGGICDRPCPLFWVCSDRW